MIRLVIVNRRSLTRNTELYFPAEDGSAIRDLVSELGIDLTDEQVASFTTQQILGIADGSLEIHRNPSTPYGHVVETVGPVGSNNGHDYV